MKPKFFILCMLMLGIGANTIAKESPKTNIELIQMFIDSHVNSDYKKLDQILSVDACYKIPRQNKVIKQSRSALLDAMKTQKGTKQNCYSSYEIIKQTSAITIARVDFKYPDFNQQNYLILEKDDNDNWKLSQVCKIAEDDNRSSKSPVITKN